MSSILSLLSDLKIGQNSKLLFIENDTFPTSPPIGCMAFVSGVLYIYANLKGIETWYPLTNAKKSYIHVQSTPSLTWTINHNLASDVFIVCVYDETSQVQYGGITNITLNTFQIEFTTAISGKAVVFVEYDQEISTSETQSIFNSIKTMDGIGSGLDADYLDGEHGSYFLNYANFTNKPTTLSGFGITDAANISGSLSQVFNTNELNINGNLIPSLTNTYDLGTSSNKIKDIYANSIIATSFNSITGLASVAPLIDGTATVGISTLAARQDHIHPTDTSRAAVASPAFTGIPTAPTATAGTSTTQIATTEFVTSALTNAILTQGVISSTTITTSSTNQAVVSNYPVTSYRTIKFDIQVSSGTNYTTTNISAIHDGTTVTINEFGPLLIGSSVGTFDCDINGGAIRLLFTPASATSTVVRVISTAINI